MKKLITVVLACLLLICISIVFFLNSKTAVRSGSIKLPGLAGEVEAHFDFYGIPHIYAQSEDDAYLTLGYLHAQDRLFQMEMLRRIARGELSEIFGRRMFKIDRKMRTLGIRSFAERYVASLAETPAVRLQKQYLAGINLFMRKGPRPVEFNVLQIPMREITLVDTVAIAGYMAFSFNQGLRSDPLFEFIRQEYGPAYLKDFGFSAMDELTSLNIPTPVLCPGEFVPMGIAQITGSNAWAVSGRKTKSGLPILAGDPHMRFSQPSVWYEAHIHTPTFELYGHYLGGVGTALLGHNKHMAWSVTMLQDDDLDVFRERVNPQNSDEVLYKGSWRPLEVRQEIVKVKGENPVPIAIRSSVHGPIIDYEPNPDQDYVYSIQWLFHDDTNHILDAFYELGRSRNPRDAAQAAEKIHSPGLNLVYADVNGHIAWWSCARVPLHGVGVDSHFILDGTSDRDEITGFQPFSQNPHSVDPQNGIVVSANHAPGGINGYYSPDFRADRITTLLQSKDLWTAADMKRLQLDTYVPYPQVMIKTMLPILRTVRERFNESEEEGFQILEAWDGHHQINSVAPTIYYEWFVHLIEKLFKTKFKHHYANLLRATILTETIQRILDNPESVWWAAEEPLRKVAHSASIIATYKDSIKSLGKKWGDSPKNWRWGRVHTVVHKHALSKQRPFDKIFSVGPFPVSGGREVVQKMSFSLTPSPFSVTSGPSTRRIIAMAHPNRTWGINPTGQSGYFFDSHSKDQAGLYHQGEYRHQWLAKADVLAHKIGSVTFKPERS